MSLLVEKLYEPLSVKKAHELADKMKKMADAVKGAVLIQNKECHKTICIDYVIDHLNDEEIVSVFFRKLVEELKTNVFNRKNEIDELLTSHRKKESKVDKRIKEIKSDTMEINNEQLKELISKQHMSEIYNGKFRDGTEIFPKGKKKDEKDKKKVLTVAERVLAKNGEDLFKVIEEIGWEGKRIYNEYMLGKNEPTDLDKLIGRYTEYISLKQKGDKKEIAKWFKKKETKQIAKKIKSGELAATFINTLEDKYGIKKGDKITNEAYINWLSSLMRSDNAFSEKGTNNKVTKSNSDSKISRGKKEFYKQERSNSVAISKNIFPSIEKPTRTLSNRTNNDENFLPRVESSQSVGDGFELGYSSSFSSQTIFAKNKSSYNSSESDAKTLQNSNKAIDNMVNERIDGNTERLIKEINNSSIGHSKTEKKQLNEGFKAVVGPKPRVRKIDRLPPRGVSLREVVRNAEGEIRRLGTPVRVSSLRITGGFENGNLYKRKDNTNIYIGIQNNSSSVCGNLKRRSTCG